MPHLLLRLMTVGTALCVAGTLTAGSAAATEVADVQVADVQVAGAQEALPAGEPPAGAVRYQRKNPVCVDDGSSITIGGAVFMQEIGKQGVTGMRVEWLLYDVDPYHSAGTPVAKRRKTIATNPFPNDARSFTFNAAQTAAQWTVGPASDDGWWLIAKMTWDRNNKRDWNYKLPVTRCG